MYEKVFIENIHTATDISPYFCRDNRNLRYVVHCHGELETAYIEYGECDIVTENSVARARRGDICIFLPSQIHNIVSVKDSNCYILKAHPIKSVESTVLYNSRLTKNIIRKGDAEYDGFFSLIQKIAREDEENRAGKDIAMHISAGGIQLELLRCGLLAKLPFADRKKIEKHTEMLDAVNGYIEEHFSENITLDDIAGKLCISRYYFAHSFKHIANMTFGEYLARYRLDKAAKLLSYGNTRITDVCYDCGFASVRSFDRTFYKYYAMTPSAFLKYGSAHENKSKKPESDK